MRSQRRDSLVVKKLDFRRFRRGSPSRCEMALRIKGSACPPRGTGLVASGSISDARKAAIRIPPL